MRVLFSTSNWMGHYFCMVPLGWALEAAGHEARVACTPEQAEAVSRTGLIPVPVLAGQDTMYQARMLRYLAVAQGDTSVPGPLPHPVTGVPVADVADYDILTEIVPFARDAWRIVERSFDAIAGFARAWRPDLVVHDLLNDEGALAAAIAGVPGVAFGPGLMGTDEDPDTVGIGPGDPTGSFPRHGLPPWTRADITHFIDPSPTSMLPPIGTSRRIPVRYVPYNGPGIFPQWTLEPRTHPLVCVLWGNGTSGTFGLQVPALRHVIDAATEHGADVVLTANAAQVAALGPLPATVRVLTSFPLHLILAASTITAHPASSNGVMAAAAAGIPQLTLPLRSEALFIGPRVARSGAGIDLPGATAGKAEISEAIEALLCEPVYAKSAAEVRNDLLSFPTPAELVADLCELARSGR